MALLNIPRRDALSAFGATGLAGIALAGFSRTESLTRSAATNDTQLLRLAAAQRAVKRQRDDLADRWGDTLDVPRTVEAEMAWLQHEAETFVEQISSLPAHTRAGVAAKAAVAAGLIGSFGLDDLDARDALVLSLCRDLQAGAAA